MNNLLAAARGDARADLVIKNAHVANVFTMEYEDVDVAVCEGKIAGLGKDYDGKEVFDAAGAVLIPGMIDGHVHIESTMLTPPAFADAVSPHGTTAVMADPHEIANALGMAGVEYMARTSFGLPIDVFWVRRRACRRPSSRRRMTSWTWLRFKRCSRGDGANISVR